MSKAQDKVITNKAMSVMDKLMEGAGAFPGALKKGQKVEGVVSAIGKKMILIDTSQFMILMSFFWVT